MTGLSLRLPRLVLQRISNKSDDPGICNSSSEAIVGRGLLVAVYVEPLIAGQELDGSVAGVADTVRAGPDCVTVTGALLFPVVAVGVILGRNKVSFLVSGL